MFENTRDRILAYAFSVMIAVCISSMGVAVIVFLKYNWQMNLSTILFFTLGAFFIVGGIALPASLAWLDFSEWWQRRPLVRNVRTGGVPKELKEWRLLFPGCCPNCGSRTVVCTQWYDVDYYDGSDGILFKSSGFSWEEIACSQCNATISDYAGSRPGTEKGQSKIITINSPFLTAAENLMNPLIS